MSLDIERYKIRARIINDIIIKSWRAGLYHNQSMYIKRWPTISAQTVASHSISTNPVSTQYDPRESKDAKLIMVERISELRKLTVVSTAVSEWQGMSYYSPTDRGRESRILKFIRKFKYANFERRVIIHKSKIIDCFSWKRY